MSKPTLTTERLADIAGAVSREGPDGTVQLAVSTDTRTMNVGDAFLALRGDRFDGTRFVRDAAAKGASCVIIEDGAKPRPDTDLPVIRVRDTLITLGRLARYYLETLDLSLIIGITGSCGKTTTKEMTAAMLSGHYRVAKTEGNLNNRVGLAKTVLECPEQAEALILEYGINMPGEMDLLLDICEPTRGAVTNIRPVHLEQLGSIEGVAREKKRLLERLPQRGLAVIPGADDWGCYLRRGLTCAARSFGWSDEDVVLSGLERLPEGLRFNYRGHPVNLPYIGDGFALNFLAACALTDGLVDAEEQSGAMERVTLPPLRATRYTGAITLIDDSYNANPESVAMMLRGAAETFGGDRRVAVLGTMLEMGDRVRDYHQTAACEAVRLGYRVLIMVGRYAEVMAQAARAEDDTVMTAVYENAAAAAAADLYREGDVVVVKGSRGVGLDHVSAELRERFGLREM